MANFTNHTPFLLTACNHSDKKNRGITLYSISDKLHFEFDEPFLYEKLFMGSQHGWITVLDLQCEPTLFNPLTGESIPLPSITTLPKVRPHNSINGNIVSYFCNTNYRPEYPFHDYSFSDYFQEEISFRKVLVSSNPSISSSNFFAAALVGYSAHLAIARPGENRWNLLQDEQSYVDIMFRHDGKLICLTNQGVIHEVELIDDGFVITEISAPFVNENCQANMYLAEDSVGRVFIIIRRYDVITVTQTLEVEVFFKLIGGEESKWERAKSLDGQAIFVGTNASILLAKKDISGEIEADTIYFTDEWWEQMGELSRNWPRDICSYNLTRNSIKPCCPFEHRHCTWPLPIWLHFSNSS